LTAKHPASRAKSGTLTWYSARSQKLRLKHHYLAVTFGSYLSLTSQPLLALGRERNTPFSESGDPTITTTTCPRPRRHEFAHCEGPFSLLLLQAGDAVCESYRLQYPGGCFFNRKRLVTGVAVLRDGHLLIGCGVRSIVAAKAPREVGMSEIVWVCAPRDFQIGKHVPVVDCCDLTPGQNIVASGP